MNLFMSLRSRALALALACLGWASSGLRNRRFLTLQEQALAQSARADAGTSPFRSLVLSLLAGSGVAFNFVGPTALLPASPPQRMLRSLLPAGPIMGPAPEFEKLGISQEICEGLESMGVHEPNDLQKQSIPMLNGGVDAILGAQTGSGKTLTYLIPIMQRMKGDEIAEGVRAKRKRPRGLVLVPTRELALQVQEVARKIGRSLKLSASVVHGGVREGGQKKIFENPVDLLVATPHRLIDLLNKKILYLGDVRAVVIDEVDTMFEEGFDKEINKVLSITTRDLMKDDVAATKIISAPAAATASRVQHIAVGATHPKAALEMYNKRLPNAKRVMIAGMHTLPKGLRQKFIVCKGTNGKLEELKDLFGRPDAKGKSTKIGRNVVFCNTQDSARFVDHTLVELGYSTVGYYGAIPANERATNFDKFRRGEASVLVASDLAARGLDNLDVKAVVQFDFPRSAAEYLHRCGRTARMGTKGTSYSLVTKHNKDIVRAIQAAVKKEEDVVVSTANKMKEHWDRRTKEIKLREAKKKAEFPSSRGVSGDYVQGDTDVQEKRGRRGRESGRLDRVGGGLFARRGRRKTGAGGARPRS